MQQYSTAPSSSMLCFLICCAVLLLLVLKEEEKIKTNENKKRLYSPTLSVKAFVLASVLRLGR